MLKSNLTRSFLFIPVLSLLVLIPNVTALKGEPVHSWHVPVTETAALYGSAADSVMPATTAAAVTDSTELVKQDSIAFPQVTLNKQASKFVDSYIQREREALAIARRRSYSYFKLMDSILARYGLPLELKYLAVVESDLKTTAVSRVGAKGMWQLMPTTARELGLKVSKKNDERTHVYKSTVAAAKYLRDLYNEYGDWLLVLAAYNGGPGKVNYAIRKAGSRNFWALQNYLPAESRGHVKRFIGTHYFFEGKGSICTLTKKEAQAYKKSVEEFNTLQLARSEQKDSSAVITTAFAR
jgi:membrane-bound lytic murein transglycosylase D